MIPDFPIDIRIRLAELKFFLLLPDFANSLPCWLSQQNWASQQGRKLAKSGCNNFFFQFCQSYSYVNRNVWYHQIWIPNNLGFIVSDIPCWIIWFLQFNFHVVFTIFYLIIRIGFIWEFCDFKFIIFNNYRDFPPGWSGFNLELVK